MPKSNNPYDLINALEDKCKELSMTASSDMPAIEDITASGKLPFGNAYIDLDGFFGVPGKEISFSEIVDYWNNNCDDDPILAEYSDFDKWWAATESYLTPVNSCDDVTAAKVVDENEDIEVDESGEDEEVEQLWDLLKEYHIATEDELQLVTKIFGYNVEILNKILHERTGYDDIDTYLEEVYPEE